MTILAPYTYLWSVFNKTDYKIPTLAAARKTLNLQAATSAFVISNGGSGLWTSVTDAIPDMTAFVKAGGFLIISVGGANGPWIQDTMTEDQMVSNLASVLTLTGSRALDFDLEGSAVDSPKIDVLNKAIAILQKQFPGLYVSYTLPIGQPQWGAIQASGLAILQNAISNGVNVSLVNGMLMDLGLQTVNWGVMSVSMVENMKTQISSLFPSKNDKELYGMLGAIFMSHQNDDGTIFSITDAKVLAEYAKAKGLGLISYWALQRDQVGTGSLAVYNNGSTVDYEYYNTIRSILGSAPTPQPTPNPSPQPTPQPTPQPSPQPTPQPSHPKFNVSFVFDTTGTISNVSVQKQ